MDLTLVVLAAGRASRYGRLKQLEPVGPHGAALFTYSVYDAARAGFSRLALVVPPGLERRFEDHVRQHCGDLMSVATFAQELSAIPPAFAHPDNRVKPWGTAHALLTAATVLSSPFAVINADDFYGAGGYRQLHGHFSREPDTAALVGYELGATLSPFGGVSRGVCDHDGEGMLTGLTELRGLTKQGDAIVGSDLHGQSHRLRGHERVSMNLWGLNSTVVAALRGQFDDFLAHSGADPTAEFLLSSALNEQVRSGKVRLRVLRTDEQWFGMTFPDDTAIVKRQIAQLIARGKYPDRLSTGLT
ncbi:MAG: NTP transferase domain-containing protein [Gemmatimonadota bacterium]|nr:NTP transferase domain-containing protein [Gemmatimonadota bacterium]